MAKRTCEYCNHEFQPYLGLCPHCARPGLYPNVHAAEEVTECEALENHYKQALDAAELRGAKADVARFEKRAEETKAVIARSIDETMRLATSDGDLYPTFEQRFHSGMTLLECDKWYGPRIAAGAILFPGYAEHIRMGALSLNGLGLSRYGECSIVMREELIAHRSSVFRENSALFVERHGVKEGAVPPGHRATWQSRSKLCVAKHAEQITPAVKDEAFADILLKDGPSGEEDVFIEVHIHGPMTRRTFERVIVRAPKRWQTRVIIKALREKLAQAGVPLEVRQ